MHVAGASIQRLSHTQVVENSFICEGNTRILRTVRLGSLKVTNSARVPKNPKDFGGDYDKIREHLEGGGGWSADLSFSTVLRNFGQSAFGNTGRSMYKFMLQQVQGSVRPTVETYRSDLQYNQDQDKKVAKKALKQFGMIELLRARQFWEDRGCDPQEAEALGKETVSLAYRAQRVIRGIGSGSWGGSRSQELEWVDLKDGQTKVLGSPEKERMVNECAELVDALTNVLVCSPREGIRLAFAHPEILASSPSEVTRLVVWLKMNLPHADIAGMIQDHPTLLLITLEEQAQGLETLQFMRKELEGAPIDAMMRVDPWMMFEDVSDAVLEIRKLWPPELVGPEALKDCEPHELVLAIRALSPQGVPERM